MRAVNRTVLLDDGSRITWDRHGRMVEFVAAPDFTVDVRRLYTCVHCHRSNAAPGIEVCCLGPMLPGRHSPDERAAVAAELAIWRAARRR